MRIKVYYFLGVFLGASFLFPFSAQAQSQTSATTVSSFCYNKNGAVLSWKSSTGCDASTQEISASGVKSDFKAVCVVQDLKKDTYSVSLAEADKTGVYNCTKYKVDGLFTADVRERSKITGTDPYKTTDQKTTPTPIKKPADKTTNTNKTTTTSGGTCPDGFSQKGPVCIPNNPFENEPGIAGKGTIGELATSVINILLYLAGIVSVIMIIIGGYTWMTARGNETQATNSRKTFTNALIGLIIVIMAYAVVQAITNFVIKGG